MITKLVTVFLIGALLALPGCTVLQNRRAARTATETVVALCELDAAQQFGDKMGGMTPAEWCSIAGNIVLFVESQTQKCPTK